MLVCVKNYNISANENFNVIFWIWILFTSDREKQSKPVYRCVSLRNLNCHTSYTNTCVCETMCVSVSVRRKNVIIYNTHIQILLINLTIRMFTSFWLEHVLDASSMCISLQQFLFVVWCICALLISACLLVSVERCELWYCVDLYVLILWSVCFHFQCSE